MVKVLSGSADTIGALAHETASRHVAPIGQLVRGESGRGPAAAPLPRWRAREG